MGQYSFLDFNWLFLVLALHLLLHWRWLASVVTGRSPEGSGFRVGLGIVELAAGVALGISPLLMPVERDLTGNGKSFLSSHKYEGISIRGSMTLKEVEEKTGVPASFIIGELKLPESISVNEQQQLGNLKRQYGIEKKSC